MLYDTPYTDAVRLLSRIRARDQQDRQFQAALHGRELTEDGARSTGVGAARARLSQSLRDAHARIGRRRG